MKKFFLVLTACLWISLVAFNNSRNSAIQNIITPEYFIEDNYTTLQVSGDVLDNSSLNSKFFELTKKYDIISIKPYVLTPKGNIVNVSSNFKNYFSHLPLPNDYNETMKVLSNTDQVPIRLDIPFSTSTYIIQVNEFDDYSKLRLKEDIIILAYPNFDQRDLFLLELNNTFTTLDFSVEEFHLTPNYINYTLKNLINISLISLLTIIPLVFAVFMDGKRIAILRIEGHSFLSEFLNHILPIGLIVFINVVIQYLIVSLNTSNFITHTYMRNLLFYSLVYLIIYSLLLTLSLTFIYRMSLHELIKGKNLVFKSLDFLYIIKTIMILVTGVLLTTYIPNTKALIEGMKQDSMNINKYKDMYILYVNGNKIDEHSDFLMSSSYQKFNDTLLSDYDAFSFRNLTAALQGEDNLSCEVYEVSESYFKNNYDVLDLDDIFYTNNQEFSKQCPNTIKNVIDFENSKTLSIKPINNVDHYIGQSVSIIFGTNLAPTSNTGYLVSLDSDILNIPGNIFFHSAKDEKDLFDHFAKETGDSIFLPMSLTSLYKDSKTFFINEYINDSFNIIVITLLCTLISFTSSSLINKAHEQDATLRVLEGHSKLKTGLHILSHHLFWYLFLFISLLVSNRNGLFINTLFVLILFIVDLILTTSKIKLGGSK